MPRIKMTQASRIAACSLVVFCALTSCNRAEETAQADQAPAIELHQYTVRGEIVSRPTETDPDTELLVRHEMIPDFRGQGGHLGMNSMTMPFPIAEALSLDSFAPGDKVALTFTVDFDAAEDRLLAYRATKIDPLPEDIELVFIRVDTYTVRARVTSLPDPANPMSEFAVHHERIDSFKGPGGHLGMDVMVMPFPLASGLSIDALSPGDIISMTFTVEFDIKLDKPVAYRATRYEQLPTNTELDLTPPANE
jgi:Cu/Ag efflux protein CusF